MKSIKEFTFFQNMNCLVIYWIQSLFLNLPFDDIPAQHFANDSSGADIIATDRALEHVAGHNKEHDKDRAA